MRYFIFILITGIISVISVDNAYSQNRYWVNGSGSWDDPNHWALVSGGEPGAPIPTAEDNVFFDNNSFTSNSQVVLLKQKVTCNDFTWNVENYKPSLKSKSFLFKSFTKSDLYINGSISINENIQNKYYADIVLKAKEKESITINTKLNSDIILDAKSGEYKLNENLSTLGDIYLKEGTFNTNDKNVNVKSFVGSGIGTRSLYLGNSEISIDVWDFQYDENLSFDAGKSNLVFKQGYVNEAFKPGNLDYNTFSKPGAKSAFGYAINVTDVTCYGDITGGIEAVITSGGTQPFTYVLYEKKDGSYSLLESSGPIASTSYTFDPIKYSPGIPAGTYLIDITDDDDDVGGGIVVVSQPTEFKPGDISVKQGLLCYDGSDAQLEANPSGGTEPYSYNWYKNGSPIGQYTKVATGLTIGTYQVYIKDAYNCKDSVSNIEFFTNPPNDTDIPDPIVFNSYNSTPECSGASNATVDISASGGTGTIEYYLYGQTDGLYYPGGAAPPASGFADPDGSFTGLTAQTYDTYAIDENGCIKQGDPISIAVVLNPTASITPVDPTICPSGSVELNGNPTINQAGATVQSHEWTGDTDDLSSLIIVNPTFTGSSLGVFNLTYTITDSNGCKGSDGVTVTVADAAAPVVTCKDIDVYLDASGSASINPVDVLSTLSDNCTDSALIGLSLDISIFDCTNTAAPVTVRLTADDGNGNTSFCEADVTVIDDINPDITCATPLASYDTDADQCYYTVPDNSLNPVLTDDNCGVATVLNNFNSTNTLSGEQFPSGVTNVIWTVTDVNGNTNTCQYDITVIDGQAPVISCPANISVGCDDDSSPTGTGTATATDNCDAPGSITIIYSDVSTQDANPANAGYYNYTITRTWRATDTEGNYSECDQIITVNDNTDPVVSCPVDITMNCDDDLSPTGTGTATATDNCAPVGNINITYSDVSSQNANENLNGHYNYTITRTWRAEDVMGNFDECTQTITVQDVTAPIITCPSDINANCDDDLTPTGTGTATAVDNCASSAYVDVTFSDVDTQHPNPNNPDHYNYTITRTWRAEDVIGNFSTCTQIITVQDVTGPDITCPADITINCDDDSSPAGTGTATATDNCSPVGIINISYSDVSTQDADPTNAGFYNYTITRTWQAEDVQGNTSQCIQVITVQDIVGPTINCPADVTVNCDDDNTPTGTGTATATDNCAPVGNINITYSDISTQGSDPTNADYYNYTITRTWRAEDVIGNFSTCTQVITVQDVVGPTISCPADVTINCDDDNTPTGTGTATATDNCTPTANIDITYSDVSTQDADPANPGYYNYTITRTWQASDGVGGTDVCVQIITVQDITNPIINCPADVTINCDDDNTPTGTGTATATDNCASSANINITNSDVSTQDPDPANAGFYNYTITRTWRAEDVMGNFDECTQTITVQDVTNPIISCPTDVSVLEDGTCSAVVNGLTPTVSDNCGIAVQDWTMSGATVNSGTGDVSGETFNIGITTVTYHVEDATGNFAECSFTVEVYDVIDGGSIIADQTICYNTIPAEFTSSADATVCGGLTYQWQKKTGTGAWGDISGANGPNYQEVNPLTEITYYNRKAISNLGYGTANSDTIVVLIQPEPTAYAGKDTTLCYGTVYQITDADTTYTDPLGVSWEILTGNGSLDDPNIINPEYTPDPSDAETVVELVLHAAGIGPCNEATDTVRLTYLSELLVSIGKPTPYFIDSTSTHIDVSVNFKDFDFTAYLGVFLVSPLDSVVELKPYCTTLPPGNFLSDGDYKFYNDPMDTSSIGTISACSPTDGRYEFSGDWKKKLHGQDPANGAWRIRLVNNEPTAGPGSEWTEATLIFTDRNKDLNLEQIIYADSSIGKEINIYDGSGPFEVTEHTLPITGLTTSCYGTCDATAVATASGGQPPYLTFEWSTNEDFSSIFATGDTVDLCVGKYYVRVIDSNGCTAIDSVTVAEPPEIIIDSDSVIHNQCNGVTEGKVVLEFSGGTGLLQYTYNGSDWYNSGDTISGLAAATYTFTIQDISGCTKDTIITINEPIAIDVTTSVDEISCYGQADATITITAIGGTPGTVIPYQYSIDSADTWQVNNVFTPLDEGKYIIVVQDSLGCIGYGDTIFINNPDTITIDSVKISHVICDGSATDGEIVIHAVGGTGDLDYSINNGVNYYPDSLFTGLSGGDYQISVRDERGCEKFLDTLVTVNGPIIITKDSVIHNNCYGGADGKVILEFTGGTGVLQYTYNGTEWYNSGDTISDLVADTYTFTIQGATGCSKDTVITIGEGLPIDVTTSYTEISCYGQADGTIEITANGGTPGTITPYLYSIDSADTWQASNTFIDLDAGRYIIVVQDSLGCLGYGDTINLVNPDPISIDSVKTTAITCNGNGADGTITVYATGGTGVLQYSLDKTNYQTSNVFTDLIPGVYSIYVIDDCNIDSLIDGAVVQDVVPVEISLVTITDIDGCYGDNTGQIEIEAIGGSGIYEYSINGGTDYQTANNFTGLFAGDYTLSVRDDDGCLSNDSVVTVNQPDELIIDNYIVKHSSECNTIEPDAGEIIINALGGTGLYTYNLMRVSDMSPSTNGDGRFTGLQVDNYTFYVNDENGCESIQIDTSIILRPAMSIDLDSLNVTCFGYNDGEVLVNINDSTGGCTFDWTGPDGSFTSLTENITGLKPGTYTVTVTDSNYPETCKSTASIEVLEPEILKADITVKDKFCVTSDAIDPVLAQGAINADGLGGTPTYNYSWVGPDGFTSTSDYLTNLDPGVYSLTLTDDNNCVYVKDTTVNSNNEYDIAGLSISIEDTAICWNEPVIIKTNYTGNADTIYYQVSEYIGGYWEASQYEVEITENPLTIEQYINGEAIFEIARVENDYCKESVTTNIDLEYFPSFNLDILDYDVNPLDDTLEIKGTTQGELSAFVSDETGLSFQWYPIGDWFNSPNSRTTIIKPEDSGMFTVVVESEDGCIDSSSIYVLFIPAIKPNSGFSPNGDNINDYWEIKYIERFVLSEVTVFNRWGVKVFEQKGYNNDDPDRRWDGTSKGGKDLPSGTYYYIIKLNDQGFAPITGSITIVR